MIVLVLSALIALGAADGITQDRLETGDVLLALRDEFPDLLQVDTIGRSAAGQEIWVGIVARGKNTAARPAALLFDYGRGGDVLGVADALSVVRELLQRASADVQVARLLDDFVFYVAPDLDPDRATDDVPRVSPFDVDFPYGWSPELPAAGPYPLHRSETRAFAAFLDAHANVVAALTFAPAEEIGRVDAPLGVGSPAADGAALRGRHPRLAPRSEDLIPGPGGVLTWCDQGLGLPVLAMTAPGVIAESAEDRAELCRSASGLLTEVAGGLPRLTAREQRTEALGGGLWLVDVAIANEGGLSTARESVRWQPGGDDVRVSVSGVDVRASAIGAADGAAFEPLRWGGRDLRLGHLGPGQKVVLRLVVEGKGDPAVGLDVRATRAVAGFLKVALR